MYWTFKKYYALLSFSYCSSIKCIQRQVVCQKPNCTFLRKTFSSWDCNCHWYSQINTRLLHVFLPDYVFCERIVSIFIGMNLTKSSLLHQVQQKILRIRLRTVPRPLVVWLEDFYLDLRHMLAGKWNTWLSQHGDFECTCLVFESIHTCWHTYFVGMLSTAWQKKWRTPVGMCRYT